MEANPYASSADEVSPPARRVFSLVAWGCVAFCVLILVPFTAMVAFVLGGIQGQSELYHSRATQQARQMQTYISQHQDKYSKLQIDETSDGRSLFEGTVKSQEDLDLLTAEMQRIFGEELGREMTNGIEIQSP